MSRQGLRRAEASPSVARRADNRQVGSMELVLALIVGLVLGAVVGASLMAVRARQEAQRRQVAVDAELQAARQRAERAIGEAQALRMRLVAAEAMAGHGGADAPPPTERPRAPEPPSRAPDAPRPTRRVRPVEPVVATVPVERAAAGAENPAGTMPVAAPAAAPEPAEPTPAPRQRPVAPRVPAVEAPSAAEPLPPIAVPVVEPDATPAPVPPATPSPEAGAATDATEASDVPASPPADPAPSDRPAPTSRLARARAKATPTPIDPGWRPLRPGLSDPHAWLGQAAPNGTRYAQDDLERIHGVGPYLARRLRDEGVRTWRQIAEWNDEDMALASRRIGSFPDRVRREDWPGSARALHAEVYGETLP